MRDGFIIKGYLYNLDFGFYLIKFIGEIVIPIDGFLEIFNLFSNTFTEFDIGIYDRTGWYIGGMDGMD